MTAVESMPGGYTDLRLLIDINPPKYDFEAIPVQVFCNGSIVVRLWRFFKVQSVFLFTYNKNLLSPKKNQKKH